MKSKLFKFGLGIVLSVAILTGCKDDESLSTLTGLTAFSLQAHDDIPGLENVAFTIDQTTKVIENSDSLAYETDVTKLVAVYEAIAKTVVEVKGEAQVSGTTVNDFSSPVSYEVIAEDGVTKITYTVKVNVSQVNPEGVSWVKENNAISTGDYSTVRSIFFKGKYLTMLGSVNAAAQSASTKFMVSEDGKSWEEQTIDAATFPIGSLQGLVEHNNKLYICGYYSITDPFGIGYLMAGAAKEVWESEDGITYKKLDVTYEFDGDKVNSALYSHNDKLWVVGGNTLGFGNPDGVKMNDADFSRPAGLSMRIHNSSDMVSWEEPAEDVIAPEAARRNSANLVHDGKMYMIGGQGSEGQLLSDVWASADGKSWTLVSEGALTARMGAAAVSYDNKIWLIGGQTALGTCSSEILVSEDGGVTWKAVEEDAQLPGTFTPRAGHSAFLDADENLWIVGGYNTTLEGEDETRTSLFDVWKGKLNKLEE
ncbi:hypothetical protein DMA11_08805 [Marinilabiliaceae bacterium JC017]|nr:hypothetical protein DMA11_08805 [Marinilabiliaceae bacterium JC017]